MANKKPLFVFCLAALMFAAYKSWNIKESIKYLQYDISGLKIRLKNLLQPEIVFAITVYNPNKTAVPVQSFFGNIINGNGMLLGSFRSESQINLAGKESQTVDVSARVSALSVVMQIIQKKKIENVKMQGMLKTGFFDMPFQKIVSLSDLGGGQVGHINKSSLNMENNFRRVHPGRHHHAQHCTCPPRRAGIKPPRGFLQYGASAVLRKQKIMQAFKNRNSFV